jgi:D-psicose/D-tagatose/L-ribulose 3-epimerase
VKIGVTTYIWAPEFTTDQLPLLPVLKEHGFDGLEVPVFRPRECPAAAIRTGMQANGLECNVSAALIKGLSLVSADAGVRAATVQHLKDMIAVAAELDARVIAGPLYAPVGELPGRRRTEDEWHRVVEAYQSLGPTLAAHDVTIAIEPLNRFETYFLNTDADAGALCEAIGHPKIGVLFDTFHANIEEKDPAASCRSLGPHLKHVHTSENDRGTPGSGHVPWREVFDTLRDMRYDDWIVIESFGFALGDLSAAASIWRDIEQRPEDVAFDGIKFLREEISRTTGTTGTTGTKGTKGTR